ncbi:hypothetical protein GJU43_13910 [Flavobacterium sp. LC2016-23]|nr:hypothetical protein [Flavobacterium sp. LC2016-23]MRX40378.1 hypothetical protein [Flavobacterium sp. LC2016-23]
MTPRQRKNKKIELEQWLNDNPNHENRKKVQSDLTQIINELLEKKK